MTLQRESGENRKCSYGLTQFLRRRTCRSLALPLWHWTRICWVRGQKDSVFGTKERPVEDTERDGENRGWVGCDDVLLLYLLRCCARHDMMSVAT